MKAGGVGMGPAVELSSGCSIQDSTITTFGNCGVSWCYLQFSPTPLPPPSHPNTHARAFSSVVPFYVFEGGSREKHFRLLAVVHTVTHTRAHGAPLTAHLGHDQDNVTPLLTASGDTTLVRGNTFNNGCTIYSM